GKLFVEPRARHQHGIVEVVEFVVGGSKRADLADEIAGFRGVELFGYSAPSPKMRRLKEELS
ncbi:MAG: hypothetical protein M1547_14005, partial [Gammaproteobacteria bacterium]|nr:hypothetical protein [Gammaproteobacteria bacterium]